MGTLSLTLPSDGEAINASDVNNPFQTIQTAINGNLDSNNLATNAVSTAKVATNAITADKVATTAISLSSVYSSTSQGSISTTPVILTGLTTTVTIPAGGRSVRVEVNVPHMASTAISTITVYIYNAATVTGSAVQTASFLQAVAAGSLSATMYYEHTPSAGSQSYCAAISVDSGTGSTTLTATKRSNINVKVV